MRDAEPSWCTGARLSVDMPPSEHEDVVFEGEMRLLRAIVNEGETMGAKNLCIVVDFKME